MTNEPIAIVGDIERLTERCNATSVPEANRRSLSRGLVAKIACTTIEARGFRIRTVIACIGASRGQEPDVSVFGGLQVAQAGLSIVR